VLERRWRANISRDSAKNGIFKERFGDRVGFGTTTAREYLTHDNAKNGIFIERFGNASRLFVVERRKKNSMEISSFWATPAREVRRVLSYLSSAASSQLLTTASFSSSSGVHRRLRRPQRHVCRRMGVRIKERQFR